MINVTSYFSLPFRELFCLFSAKPVEGKVCSGFNPPIKKVKFHLSRHFHVWGVVSKDGE